MPNNMAFYWQKVDHKAKGSEKSLEQKHLFHQNVDFSLFLITLQCSIIFSGLSLRNTLDLSPDSIPQLCHKLSCALCPESNYGHSKSDNLKAVTVSVSIWESDCEKYFKIVFFFRCFHTIDNWLWTYQTRNPYCF